MSKRKGSSVPSSSRARDKAAKEGSDAKRAFEHECAQLGRDISALEAKQGKLEEQLGPLRREVERVERDLLAKIKRLEEVKNAQRLGKLPPEVWEKILGELGENDLFPLALSCRYFRQKQKELLARPRQRELEWFESPSRALATDISRWPQKGHRASAEYLRFIRREKVPRDVGRQKAKHTRRLAAYHGHLPLLQELLDGLKTLKQGIAQNAGGSPLPQSLLFCFGF